MENYKLTDKLFETEIQDIVIPSIFQNMNSNDRNILFNYIIKIINIIAICFSFDIEKKRDDYLYQFRQNNYQDTKWLIFHLLPYISIESNSNDITSFNDIYIKKKNNVNINEDEPNYIYSNIQYNRFIRENGEYKERPFNIEDLNHNYYLLINSIRNCSNKLCANWINLLPYTTKSYYESNLYKNTIKSFASKKIFDWDPLVDTNIQLTNETLCQNLNEKSKGLYIGHIYEEIADLYYSIKDYKWIIYDITKKNEIFDMTMTEFIKFYFSRTYKIMLKISDWDNITEIEKKEFKTDLEALKQKISIQEEIYSFMRGFILAFDKSFDAKNAAKDEDNKYISIEEQYPESKRKKLDFEDEDEDVNFKKEKIYIEDNIILNSFNSLREKFIFEFISESLQKLKQTWYGYYLLTNDKNDILEVSNIKDENDENMKYKLYQHDIYLLNDEIKIEEVDIVMNYEKIKILLGDLVKIQKFNAKYIYNFSKSFVHYQVKNKFISFPKNWASLTQENKKMILNRINGKVNPLDWFNISGYIKRLNLHQIYEDKLKKYDFSIKIKISNLMIYRTIKTFLISIIFESLIHKGILTQFIPDKERSEKRFFEDGNLEKVTKNEKQKKILAQNDNNEYWTNSYHYLTSLRYKDMDTNEFFVYEEDKQKKTIEKYNYFSYGLKRPWYVAGAYDWVGQIGFCHHFINNRIIFITGGTGVGKSTEIPKLFMYYAKVIDGVSAPKVVCTQPRQNAVETNAKRVSSTLGVPIIQNKDKTKNFFIQFKHKMKNHKQNTHFPSLMFITGDSLMLELDDPLLKRKRKSKEKDKPKEYSLKNQYDIIMIDEAHEHKKHMDLLMTFLKLPLSQNNSLRLVIVSATMDDDEPKYRRFFRDITDNKKFPLDTWISTHKLDRINIDRRYHIAPPGAGTRFEIKENYRPLKNDNELYDKIKEITNEILKKSSEGDILIFQPGVGEISETIKILNANTPSKVIAIPYHSELTDDRKDIIMSIDASKNKIKMDKTSDFATTDYTQGNNQYERFIIVSTNIAEASITIDTLRFVIETGTEKAQIYDYTKRNERIFKDIISESSRRQRKGRVGRVAPGEVYYLYPKGTTENNKIPYEFSRMKIDDIIYRYLRENREKEDILSQYDFCNKNFKLKQEDIKKSKELSKSTKEVLEELYFIDGKYYDYYGNDDFYDYENYKRPYKYYKTGTDAITINDNTGEYFIIHPEELELKRNIGGDIVGVKNSNNKDLTFQKIGKYKGIISSKKVDSFWELLLDCMYVGIISDKPHDIKSNQISDYFNSNYDLIKTETGGFFSKNSESFSLFDSNLLRTVIYGLSLDYKDIIKFCALCEVISYDLTKLFINIDEKTSSISLLYDKFGQNISSDGEIIMNILNEYHNIFKKYDILNGNIYDKRYFSSADIKENNINLTKEQIIELLGKKENHSEKLKDSITSKNLDNIIKTCSIMIQKNIVKLVSNSNYIQNWCAQKYISFSTIKKYTEKYFELEASYLRIINENDESYNFIKKLKNKFISIDEKYKKNKLLTSLLFGFSQNIVVKIHDTNKYLSLYTPNYQNIFTISAFTPNIPKSFINQKYSSEYLLFLENNIEKDEIMMLFHINIQDILLLSHIYHINFDVGINIDNDKNKFIEDKIKKYELAVKMNKPHIEKFRLTITGSNTNNTMINYMQTIKKIMNDFSIHKQDIYSSLEFIRILEPGMQGYINSLQKEN
jgi:hypothetical protein